MHIAPRSTFRSLAAATAIAVAGALGVFALPSPASACSCLMLEDSLRMGNQELVFVGTVADVAETGVGRFGDETLDVRFDVETVFTGEAPADAVLQTTRDNGANCGMNPSGRLLVAAYRTDDGWSTDGCSSAPVGADDADPLLLTATEIYGEGSAPLSPETTPGADETGSSTNWLPIAAGVAFVTILAGGAVLMLRD